MQDHNFPTNV